MPNLHTITLEILRPGPSHNQMLSPLTSYLALCDNRGAVTLTLPFEHRELLRQREALSYTQARAQREAQLHLTADTVGTKVLGAIATLNAALASGQADQYGKDTLIHLRLILSAAELAMMPFELATAPPGFPGEAKPMLLQSIAPITMTREVRGATISRGSWSRPPRILVVAATPPGFAPVPLRGHLLALRRALDPFVPTEKQGGIRGLITLLPQASVQAIRVACAREDFTHVHILAHGARSQEGGDDRFGLALLDDRGQQVDIVGGNRLASVLRTHRVSGEGFSCPNFVTLCTCESGDVSSVVFPGASLAHDLHEAGVPWVVASQFPLSMTGSTILTELLYEGLLRGDDPRVVLHRARLCLRAECPATHDWASVVAYAAVPPDFADQVREARQRQAQRAINVAFAHVDELLSARTRSRCDIACAHERVDEILRRLDGQIDLLRRSVPEGDGPGQRGRRADLHLRQGSVEKRRAYVLFEQERRAAEGRRPPARDPDGERRPWATALARARRSYLAAARLELGDHRPLTQLLSAQCILGEEVKHDHWTVARVAAELALDSNDEKTRARAHASLAELHLLQVLWSPEADLALAERYAVELLRVAGPDSPLVESTRRQLERYLDWLPPCQSPRFTEGVRRLLDTLLQDC